MEVGWIRRRSAVSEPVELMGWMDSTVQPWPRGSSAKEEGRDGGDEEEEMRKRAHLQPSR